MWPSALLRVHGDSEAELAHGCSTLEGCRCASVYMLAQLACVVMGLLVFVLSGTLAKISFLFASRSHFLHPCLVFQGEGRRGAVSELCYLEGQR